MFIKLYESALFLKYYNVKLHINTTKYFGETLEGTGQARRLGRLSHKKASQQYGVLCKRTVNEFVKTHLLAISLGFMSQTLLLLDKFPYNIIMCLSLI